MKGLVDIMIKLSEIFAPIKWHLLACAAVFILLPALGLMLPADVQPMMAFACVIANNIVITITCVWLTIKDGFKWYYPIMVAFLYIVSLLAFYPTLTAELAANVTAYLAEAYMAQIIGVIVSKLIERNK